MAGADVHRARDVALRDCDERAGDVVDVQKVASLLARRRAGGARRRAGRAPPTGRAAADPRPGRRDRTAAPTRELVAEPSHGRAASARTPPPSRAHTASSGRAGSSPRAARRSARTRSTSRHRRAGRSRARANERARLSATSSCAEFSGDVRYSPGVAIHAQWMQTSGSTRETSSVERCGISQVAPLDPSVDTVEPRPGLRPHDRVNLDPGRRERARHARPDEARRAGHETLLVMLESPVVRDVVLERDRAARCATDRARACSSSRRSRRVAHSLEAVPDARRDHDEAVVVGPEEDLHQLARGRASRRARRRAPA